MDTKQMVTAVFGTVLKVVIAVLVIVFVYKAAVTAYDYGYRVFQEPPVSAEPGMDVTVEITVGKSAMQIGEILEQKGLIRDARLFYVQNLLSHYKDELSAGTYTLNTSMTMEEMMEIMSAKEPEETGEDTGETGGTTEETGNENDNE